MGWQASRKAAKKPHKVENPMILVQCVDKKNRNNLFKIKLMALMTW